MKKKIIFPIIAAGCLAVGLTAGFIAGRNSSKVIIESEPYHIEDADYSIGVSKQGNEGIDIPNETIPPKQSPTPESTSAPNDSSFNYGVSGNSGSVVSNQDNPSQGGDVGAEQIYEDEKDVVAEKGADNNAPGALKSVTYNDYMQMTPDERGSIASQFPSTDQFYDWVDAIKNDSVAADAERTYSGSVNIDETFGNE